MSFSQALSGLNAQSQKLGTIGNNIANSQTVGFKGSNVQFSDVFANSRVGLGTRVSTVLQNFSEGNIESTNRNLDLAVAGEGFYRFQQPSGEVAYSRNGQLTMTAEGDLINSQGAKIMGFGLADQNDPFSPVIRGGQPVALNVPSANMPARATGTSDENPGVRAVYNLDASIDIDNADLRTEATVRTSDPGVDPAVTATFEYHYSNSYTVFDSLGNSRNVTSYFEKMGPNAWTVRTAIDGHYDAANDFDLDFTTNGVLERDANGAVIGIDGGDRANLTFNPALLGGGVDPLVFDFDLRGTTQFAGNSTQSSLVQDGYGEGALVGITIEPDGSVMRNFSNEQSVSAGQIVLASFRNPEGLTPAGDNLWTASMASGEEVRGVPGEGRFGTIQAGAVETSNVDMARELVDMIVAQRAYQANSQTIKTQDELLRDAINLR